MLRNLVKFSSIPRVNCSYTVSRNVTYCNLYWLNVPSVHSYEQNKFICSNHVQNDLLRPQSFNVIKENVRFKSKSQKSKTKQDDSDSDEESYEIGEEGYDNDGNKLKTIKLKSTRVDNVLLKCMGFTRRKMDELFLEKKLRYNGSPLPKKSVEIKEGDSLEICTDPVDTGATTETIAKVNIINIKPMEESSTFFLTFSVDKRK